MSGGLESDRAPQPELAYGVGDCGDCLLVVPGVALVRDYSVDSHGSSHEKRFGDIEPLLPRGFRAMGRKKRVVPNKGD